MLAAIAQTVPNRTDTIPTPAVAWEALAPVLILIGGAVLILGASALTRRKPSSIACALTTIVAALASMASAVPLWRDVTGSGHPYTAVKDAIAVDGFSVFFVFLVGAAVVLAALLADGYLRREGLDVAELYVLILLSASGGLIMAAANDLIVLFLGLEILSIAAYVLAAMHLRRTQSQEAGMKYFVLGAFSSAFFLYGIALIYGSTGSTNLSRIAGFGGIHVTGEGGIDHVLRSTSAPPALLLAGLALLLVGFGFKVAAVPFHSWTPDVYQGSPTPVVAFMASAVKAAGFAGLLRVFVITFHGYETDWKPYMYALAVATMLVGSVLAVVQTDVKRMLAYSSINHAGFILVGVQAATAEGISAALFYLAAYTFMVVGSFGVVTLVSRRGDARTSLDDFKGLSRQEPLLAFVFAIFLFAQAGVPLTSGFFAKFYVLEAAINAHSWPLAITAMVSAVIAAFLYLRITVSMYMTDEETEEAAPAPVRRLPIPFGAGLALAVTFAVTLYVGFLPSSLADTSRDAVPSLAAPDK